MDYPYVKNQYWYTGTDNALPKAMRILIGVPIHESKDYAIERWLENVLRLEYPADLFMVDSSHEEDYAQKVKEYCAKKGMERYKIEHIEVGRYQPFAEKINKSREIIRQEILKNDYDAWLSWESDYLVPVNALDKVVAIMRRGNYLMVHASAKFGFSLIKREVLERYSFLLEHQDVRNCWAGGEEWLKKQVLKNGGNYVEIFGVINPIHRLEK